MRTPFIHIAFCLFFAGSFAIASGVRPSPNIYGETISQTAERTGYTVAEIERYFPPVEIEFLDEGLAVDRFKAPPAAYVHPRIFFNPEDLPDLRKRLSETQSGRTIMGQIRKKLAARLTGERALHRADYDALAAGEITEFKWPQYWELTSLLVYEAFRCLIDGDTEAGQQVAAALTAYASCVDAEIEFIQLHKDYQKTYVKTYHQNLGLIYDFAYQFMDTPQRDKVRSTIAKSTQGAFSTNSSALPAFPANTSNWVPAHMGLMTLVLSIEGEAGYDDRVYRQLVETAKRWVSIGIFPEGAPFEGLGKNQLGAEVLLMTSKRGDPLIASSGARNHIARWYLYSMQPFGGAFTWWEDWGGSYSTGRYADVEIMKYAFPDDPAIDTVYRNHVGEDYAMHLNFHNPWSSWMPLYRAITASDYHEGTWQASMGRLDGLPLSAFFNRRGMLSTRSDWSTDATQLIFQPRSIPGGHSSANRNMFTMSALGRVWAEHITGAGSDFVGACNESRYQSVPLIDQVGQAYNHTPAARVVALADEPWATFACGDATDAYNYRIGPGHGAEPSGRTPNDSLLYKSKLPWMDLPWSELPVWTTGLKPEGLNRYGSFVPFNSVERAYRTAGLVRGAHPYVLIIDDIQKDAEVHAYDWLMQVPNDLEVESILVTDTENKKIATSYRGPKPNYVADLVLASNVTEADDRRLLVRVLQNDTEPKSMGQPAYLETYLKYVRAHRPGKRLVIPSTSVAPNYKVLLYPYRKGQAQPITLWNKDKTQVTITIGDQRDVIDFSKNTLGKTAIVITRNGETLVEIH